ncbi:Beta-barrel assembly-enhancing protease [termite gut metagenome]|uniref:Beta-barrel assembly-enhancing protease n=1 Tax=termite gut metagenome TaxID=433724 RepID=A0A5J4SJM3_9ZZZZ
MNADRLSPDDEAKELVQLVAQYEWMKSNNRNFYMDAEQILDIAEWYESNDEPDSAYDVLIHGLSLHPDHPDILISLAYSYIDKEQLEEAENIAGLIDDEYSVEVKMLKIELLFMQDKVSEAEMILDTISEEDPNLYVDIAGLYIQRDNIPQGLLWFQKALALNPDDEDLVWTIAECCSGIERYEEAIHYYNQLIDKQPYSSDYWIGLAKVYFSQEQYDKTIEACDFALVGEGITGLSDAHLFKAHSLFQLQNYTESIKEYHEVLLEPGGDFLPEYIYTYIGSCYNEMGEWEQACTYYEKALHGVNTLELEKEAEAYMLLAFCHYKMGRWEKAQELCHIMEDLYPNASEPYLLDGRIYFQNNDKENAARCWDYMLNKKPDDVSFLVEMGEFCLDAGDYERARFALEKVVAIEPNNLIANMLLYLIYVQCGDWKSLLTVHYNLDIPMDAKLKALLYAYCEENDSPLSKELLKKLIMFEENSPKDDKQ